MRHSTSTLCLVAGLLLTAGCADDGAAPAPRAQAGVDADASDVAGELRATLAEATALADSVEDLLRPVPLLTPGEEAALRRASNAAQLARARQLGAHVADTATLQELVRAGRLVALEDSTAWWIVRELDQSLPYATPDVRALLEQIGRRFQERITAMGLPPYRLEITSVLRMPADQAALRGSNVNAARGTSTHEFGTTLDIAYESFAAPAADVMPAAISAADTGATASGSAGGRARAGAAAGDVAWLAHELHALALERVAARKSRELQKLLGGVLRAMQDEGLLLVTLERQQPVYHLTVARRIADE